MTNKPESEAQVCTDSTELSVAVCQLTSVDDVQANLNQILGLMKSLESDPPDLICFPENALYFRLREGEPMAAIEVEGDVVQKLSAFSVKFGSVIHLGSVPLLRGDRLYSSSVVLMPDGTIHDHYQKIHLFDVDVEGVKPMRESDVFAHGIKPSILSVKGWKIGSSICYDLRFAELFLYYARNEVDVLLIPASFLVPTGKAHWDILTRARAIECQAYVLAAAQGEFHVGKSGATRSTYGNSVVIDPWGEILASVPSSGSVGSGFSDVQRILRAKLSRQRIRQVRAQIPMKNHRRLN